MTETLLKSLALLATIIEIAGAFALMLGFVIVSIKGVRQYCSQGLMLAVKNYRQSIARVVLIGLEILVAATIIKTIALDPTMENIGLLGVMVLIRTALSWTMALEVYGRWPWQRNSQKNRGGF
jgi:uncharacterized membrane protein